jgi:hypothetical protein
MPQQGQTTNTNLSLGTIRDENGQVAMVIGNERTVIFDALGNTQTIWRGESIQLACGGVYPPPFGKKGEQDVGLAVCGVCRSPQSLWDHPSHGVFYRQAGQRCAKCHRSLCPRHAQLCKDGEYRCRQHAQRYRVRRALKGVLMWLLFESEK